MRPDFSVKAQINLLQLTTQGEKQTYERKKKNIAQLSLLEDATFMSRQNSKENVKKLGLTNKLKRKYLISNFPDIH